MHENVAEAEVDRMFNTRMLSLPGSVLFYTPRPFPFCLFLFLSVFVPLSPTVLYLSSHTYLPLNIISPCRLDLQLEAWRVKLCSNITAQALARGRRWRVQCPHIEKVKTYAPHVLHVVADVKCEVEA